jgi:ketosteroid isomerase-like protein
VIDREAVQAAVDAFASGDPERIVRHVDPEFEGVVPPSMSAEPDNYVGHDGVRRYFESFEETIADLRFESTIAEESGDWVLVQLRVTGQGRTSGIPVELGAVAAVLMRDGRLLRMVGYPDLEEARVATLGDGPC